MKRVSIASKAARKAVEGLSGDERAAALQLAQQTQWRNKAVSDLYEPGSVFNADSVSKQDGQTSTAPRSTKNEPQSMPDVFSDDDFNNAGGFDDNFGGFGNDQEWPF